MIKDTLYILILIIMLVLAGMQEPKKLSNDIDCVRFAHICEGE